MKPKAFVTGASGFLGRHVCRELSSSGFEVIGFGHGHWSGCSPSDFGIHHWIEGDVTTDALQRCAGSPDVVVHCAGSSSVGLSIEDPKLDFDKSVNTLHVVLDYLRRVSPQSTLVFPSSAAVYGASHRLPIKEDEQVLPVSPYGHNKLIAEQLCKSYARNYGLKIVAIRFFSLFGNGLRKQLIWDACVKLAQERFVFQGTGDEIRDWLHVEDAARLVLQSLVRASTDCAIVNGGSGCGIKVRDALNFVGQAYGFDQPPEFTGDARLGDPSTLSADAKRARSFGWTPQIEFKSGIESYVVWFKGLGA